MLNLLNNGQLTFRLFHFSFVSADLLLFFFLFLIIIDLSLCLYTVRSAFVSGYIQGDTQLRICMYIYICII